VYRVGGSEAIGGRSPPAPERRGAAPQGTLGGPRWAAGPWAVCKEHELNGLEALKRTPCSGQCLHWSHRACGGHLRVDIKQRPKLKS